MYPYIIKTLDKKLHVFVLQYADGKITQDNKAFNSSRFSTLKKAFKDIKDNSFCDKNQKCN